MNILAFDTCFDACSACVARRDNDGVEVLAAALERFETGHAERLVPMVDEVMERAGVSFKDIDRLAVTVGPGTFTGTRIGIAAARGLSLTTGIAVVGISSLAVMAEVAVREIGPRTAGEDLVVAVDARRGEVYAQAFGASGREETSPPLLLPIEEAARLGHGGALVIVGSGAAAVAEAAKRAGRHAEAGLAHLLPDATALAALAVGLAPAAVPLAPLYLRAPDAKPQAGKSIARAPR
jgi:tRNA threonylcarbamoyladenosine biosynthesis protein TsaB